MKKLILLLAMAIICLHVSAQEEPGKTKDNKDTIRVGGIIIVKKGKNNKDGDVSVKIGGGNGRRKNKKVSTNWWILDLGFANYNDKSNYVSANTSGYLKSRPGYPDLDKNDFKLKAGKSINVNIWVFMQRVSLIKNYVNLKYGFGVELNNYRYKSAISYREDGLVPYTAGTQTNAAFIFRDSISFTKNKLAADYATVPVMLNFVSNPDQRKKGVSLSLGVSAGYLYSQRNKQKSSERGKLKNKGDYDLERFKFSYVAELGLGPVLLYGSYSPKSMYEKSLDIRPYNVGFRFSYW